MTDCTDDPRPAGFSAADAETARILLKAYRRPAVEGAAPAELARRRAIEVRAAFADGCRHGSDGFMDDEMVRHAWRHSRTARRLRGGERGQDVVGMLVVCSDRRAAGRDAWRIAGVDGQAAWIASAGPGERIDLIVALDTLRDAI